MDWQLCLPPGTFCPCWKCPCLAGLVISCSTSPDVNTTLIQITSTQKARFLARKTIKTSLSVTLHWWCGSVSLATWLMWTLLFGCWRYISSLISLWISGWSSSRTYNTRMPLCLTIEANSGTGLKGHCAPWIGITEFWIMFSTTLETHTLPIIFFHSYLTTTQLKPRSIWRKLWESSITKTRHQFSRLCGWLADTAVMLKTPVIFYGLSMINFCHNICVKNEPVCVNHRK